MPDSVLVPGMLVRFKPRIVVEGRGYEVWPGAFNKSGVMIIHLDANSVGVFVSKYRSCYNDGENTYLNILIAETVLIVRADQTIPYFTD